MKTVRVPSYMSEIVSRWKATAMELNNRLGRQATTGEIAPKEFAKVLLGPYLLGVELASMLLLAGLIGAYHLGRSAAKEGPGGKS